MRKLVAIGELLIDFAGDGSGSIAETERFCKHAGGAPANVAAQFSKLGGESSVISQVGDDAFGHYLIGVLDNCRVNTSSIKISHKHNTPLAFVSIGTDGARDFSFMRKDSSDLYLRPADIDENLFVDSPILHFCSVDLVDFPVREAHLQAIKYAKKHHSLISFDPNLRFGLWGDKTDLKKTVLQFIKEANILKMSEEEANFLCEPIPVNEWIQSLWKWSAKIILITKGSKGSTAYFPNGQKMDVPAYKVKAVDTTGAGDSFMGAFLYGLGKLEHPFESSSPTNEMYECLKFASLVSAYSVTKPGAISSFGNKEEVASLLLKSK